MLETVRKSPAPLEEMVESKGCFEASQLRELEQFGRRVTSLGVNFAVCDGDGRLTLLCEGGVFKSDAEELKRLGKAALQQGPGLSRLGRAETVLAAVLKTAGKPSGTVLIDLPDKPVRRAGRDEKSNGQNRLPGDVFIEMLALLVERFEADAKAREQIEMVSTELAQVYEELVLLHKLSMNMKVTEPDANYLQMACDSLTDIVSVEGIAILLERDIDGERKLVAAAGSGLIDVNEHLMSVLRSRLGDEIRNGKESLLDSEVDCPFRYQWPENVKNIIAVPLFGREKARLHCADSAGQDGQIIGLMVAINRVDKADFDSTDVKLFNSVANGCAVFVENGRLFGDLKELFIGSLKALTSSIDAKDPYTRGHSERVAFISRWIAERLTGRQVLDEEQIHRIYLAGLLHDIGKVGINEAVLRKKGKLTKAEYDHIKKHPPIGAGILSGIKQMSDIVPGVLSHHERIDGRGYPNGLTGEQIPLIARIIGLADSFDAMTSKRTYREALSLDEALAEIEKGLGSQFDEQIGRVFIESDVYRLWDIMQAGFAEVYGSNDFSRYGAMAVGALVR